MSKTRNRRAVQATSLSRQATELMLATPQVVAHRVSRMAAAGGAPSARDRREFHRMGAEKVEAFQESWAAMGSQAWATQLQWGASVASAWSAWMRLGFNPWQPGAGLSMARAAGRNATQMQSMALGVAGKGLAPVHRRAVANAKRLAGRR